MQSSRLAVAALAAAVVFTGTALACRGRAPDHPAPPRPAGTALVSAPAGPSVNVEGAATIAGSARGTRLTLNTTGASQGSAGLTFKNAAPPMHFTLTLAQMLNYNLESLTLSSGRLSLEVGAVL